MNNANLSLLPTFGMQHLLQSLARGTRVLLTLRASKIHEVEPCTADAGHSRLGFLQVRYAKTVQLRVQCYHTPHGSVDAPHARVSALHNHHNGKRRGSRPRQQSNNSRLRTDASTSSVNTECERLDSRFIAVLPTRRLRAPVRIRTTASSADVMVSSVRLSTYTPLSAPSRRFRLGLLASSKSKIFSL